MEGSRYTSPANMSAIEAMSRNAGMAMMKYVDKGNFVLLSLALTALSLSGNSGGSEAVSVDTRSLSSIKIILASLVSLVSE